MKRNSVVARSKRSSRVQTSQILNATIDLTSDENTLCDSSISDNSCNSQSRPSTSTDPDIIDLSIEGDDEQESLASWDFHITDLLEKDDDLPPPPKIPIFDRPKFDLTCPVCFNNLFEVPCVMTTKCGHMFCKDCILSSLQHKSVCPMCRKKALKSQVHVVYLNT